GGGAGPAPPGAPAFVPLLPPPPMAAGGGGGGPAAAGGGARGRATRPAIRICQAEPRGSPGFVDQDKAPWRANQADAPTTREAIHASATGRRARCPRRAASFVFR
ncbi:hypothetical protein DF052_27895, partial [Burkholderia glumae]